MIRCASAGLDLLQPNLTVTPPAYNEQVFESAAPAQSFRRIGAFTGAQPSSPAEREHEQEGVARCSFASARSR